MSPSATTATGHGRATSTHGASRHVSANASPAVAPSGSSCQPTPSRDIGSAGRVTPVVLAVALRCSPQIAPSPPGRAHDERPAGLTAGGASRRFQVRHSGAVGVNSPPFQPVDPHVHTVEVGRSRLPSPTRSEAIFGPGPRIKVGRFGAVLTQPACLRCRRDAGRPCSAPGFPTPHDRRERSCTDDYGKVREWQVDRCQGRR